MAVPACAAGRGPARHRYHSTNRPTHCRALPLQVNAAQEGLKEAGLADNVKLGGNYMCGE